MDVTKVNEGGTFGVCKQPSACCCALSADRGHTVAWWLRGIMIDHLENGKDKCVCVGVHALSTEHVPFRHHAVHSETI